MLFQLYIGNNGNNPSPDYRGVMLAWYPEQIVIRDVGPKGIGGTIQFFPKSTLNSRVAEWVWQYVHNLKADDKSFLGVSGFTAFYGTICQIDRLRNL